MLRQYLLVCLILPFALSTAVAQDEFVDRPQFELDSQPSLSDEELIAPGAPETLADWPSRSINDIAISLAESGRVPEDRSGTIVGFGRPTAAVDSTFKVYAWEAPNIRYQPLYFEDVALERYGQTLPAYRQAIRSAWHMAKSYTGIGLQSLETPLRSCDYPLGFCRPGNCVPQTNQRHFFGALSVR